MPDTFDCLLCLLFCIIGQGLLTEAFWHTTLRQMYETKTRNNAASIVSYSDILIQRWIQGLAKEALSSHRYPFVVDFCCGICSDLSDDISNDAAVQIFMNTFNSSKQRLNVTQFWKISLNVTLKYIELHNLL